MTAFPGLGQPDGSPSGVIAGTSTQFNNFIHMVRMFTRDFALLNRLTAGEESGNRFIAWAIMDTLSDFNGTPPITNYSLEDLLSRHQQALLLRGATASLLESVGFLMTRNQLSYSDGGITVSIDDKAPMLQAWIQLLRGKYEQMKRQVKTALNIESLWGTSGVNSEHFFINGSYGMF